MGSNDELLSENMSDKNTKKSRKSNQPLDKDKLLEMIEVRKKETDVLQKLLHLLRIK